MTRFDRLVAEMAVAPLHDAVPARAGEGVATLGFALAAAASWVGSAGLVLVWDDRWAGEEGVAAPRGLGAFGVDLKSLVGIAAGKSKDALWATEQALCVPGAAVVAALADEDINLTASRRLLLQAERSHAHVFLVRACARGQSGQASAAHTRWRIAAAPSNGSPRKLGPPAFSAELLRRRGGPAGACFILEWCAHAHNFRDVSLAGDLVAAPFDRSAALRFDRTG